MYTTFPNLRNVTEGVIVNGKLPISFPSIDCPSNEPVTLCQWSIETSSDRYIVTTVDKLVHTAPDDEYCPHFGIFVTNVPQHAVVVWLGEVYFKWDHWFHSNVYDEHNICNATWVQAVPSKADQGKSIHSTSHNIIITLYAYMPYLKSVPSVNLHLQVTKEQNVPHTFDANLRQNSLIVSPWKHRHIRPDEVEMMTSASRPCQRIAVNENILHPEIISMLLSELKQVLRKFIAGHHDRQPAHYFQFENFFQCIYTSELHNIKLNLIIVKPSSEVHVSYSPLNLPFCCKEATMIYVTPEKKDGLSISLFNFHLVYHTGSYSYSQTFQSKEVRKIHRLTEAKSYFSLLAVYHCTKNTTVTCREPSMKVNLSDLCNTFHLFITEDTNVYYQILWIINNPLHVIILKYNQNNCLYNSGISLSINIERHILFVPKISHDIVIYLRKIMTLYPGEAHVILKTSSLHHINKELSMCNVEFDLYQEMNPAYQQLSVTKLVRVDPQLTKLGVRHIVQRLNRRHYVLRSALQETNWYHANELCDNILNATAFSYLTNTEMKDITQQIPGMPSPVFTGFKKLKKVGLCLSVILSSL